MDLAQLTNAPREVVLGGLPYKVSALTLREWGGLQAWLKDRGPEPVGVALAQIARAEAVGTPIAPADRQFLMREARVEAKAWPPRVASAEWFEALQGTDGGEARFAHAVLSKHQPTLTVEQADAVAEAMGPAESATLVRLALGLEKSSPKADAAATTAGAPDPAPSGTTGPSPSTGSTAATAS